MGDHLINQYDTYWKRNRWGKLNFGRVELQVLSTMLSDVVSRSFMYWLFSWIHSNAHFECVVDHNKPSSGSNQSSGE